MTKSSLLLWVKPVETRPWGDGHRKLVFNDPPDHCWVFWSHPLSPMDLLITCSQARPTEVQGITQGWGQDFPPLPQHAACGFTFTGLSMEEESAPSSWWGPAAVPASWSGWCWLSSPCHVDLLADTNLQEVAATFMLKWKNQCGQRKVTWEEKANDGVWCQILEVTFIKCQVRYLDFRRYGQGVYVGFRLREWHVLWGLVSLHRL